jgi:NADPH-dependent 2,4-dienoyl-CoA reductase/sulfur reductase-like enzyme
MSGHGNGGVAAPRTNRELGDHAVVVGGGMAGLVAARVLGALRAPSGASH